MSRPVSIQPRSSSQKFALHFWNRVPLELRWQGWRTSTVALQERGWDIVANEYVDHYSGSHVIRLGAQSPDGKILISGDLHIPYGQILGARDPTVQQSFMLHNSPFDVTEIARYGLDMATYTMRDSFSIMPGEELSRFNGMIPVMPEMTPFEVSTQQRDLQKIKLFEQRSGIKEIIIPAKSVDECLDRILQLQYPQQKEMKKGLVLPEKQPIIQAKLFTLSA